MNKQEQHAVKRYLHDIKRTLPVYRKMERQFLSDIRSTIEEYAETGAVITLTTLKQEFGEPKDHLSYIKGWRDPAKRSFNLCLYQIYIGSLNDRDLNSPLCRALL